MPRMMSFSMTTPQFEAGTKDVTRRLGWWGVGPGSVLMAVEKAMGLRKGQKVRRIDLIEVVSARAERLDAITADDCIREGFPGMAPSEFVEMFCHQGCDPSTVVNRIEFRRLYNNSLKPTRNHCLYCSGSGKSNYDGLVTCPVCHGSGRAA